MTTPLSSSPSPSSEPTPIPSASISSSTANKVTKRGRMPKPKKETPPAKRRVRTGCLTCRRKHKKCDETRPKCEFCVSKNLECVWPEEVKKNVFVNNSFKDFCFQTKHTKARKTPSGPEGLTSLEYHLGGQRVKRRKTTFVPEMSGQFLSAFDGYTKKSDYIDNSFALNYPIVDRADSPLSGLFNTFQDLSSENPNATSGNTKGAHSMTNNSSVNSLSETKHTGSSTSSITSEVSVVKKEPDFEHRYSFSDLNNNSYIASNNSNQYYALPDTLKDFMSLVAATKDTTANNKLPNNENIFEFFADKSTMAVTRISDDEMMLLMDNYIDEVSFLLNKNPESEANAFVTEIPVMAEKFPALQYAMLALSSRHLEKVSSIYNGDNTLQFYNYSLQQLSLSLNSNKDVTPLVATCLLLCYFEIISTEASSWRDCLSKCGLMLSACGINAASENSLEQSLFWSFISLDIGSCSVGENSTIIPVKEWFTTDEIKEVSWVDGMKNITNEFHSMLFLSAKVTELIVASTASFDDDWKLLWECLSQWEINRSNSMRSCFSYKREDSFPESLFSNPNAISANQLFHMCCIIMLQNKPRMFKLSNQQQQQTPNIAEKSSLDSLESTTSFSSNLISKSQIWHAKQIIGINLCNMKNENRRNLGCQVLSLQCIWVAGKLISSDHEHATILKLLNDIESWCGLCMSWRGKQLVEFWNSEC
ncbi:hypothetical protein CANARDRAFT_193581 [[Candida] arabinofermentans NRRL YB-2248]|uniref:Zn(2)-C6 fungal-type domain-containing protein n=1 Tax=[Candida] arabinofermentans NRRL YB-2248 TaxID=983967 RepID=A0A1E4T7U6_9ASCO|nr:hypothetical protein CANARDRAFT_193581 [[Candida] arabinofermentans NRRL YB-2248]